MKEFFLNSVKDLKNNVILVIIIIMGGLPA